MAATGAEHSVRRVHEVHVAKLMSVIGTTCGGTVVREGHTLPFATVQAGDVDGVGFVGQGRHLGTSAVKRDTLASGHIDLHTGLDGQVRRDHEVVVGRVDADWAVGQVPHWVGGDVSRNIRTLAFVWHDTVVDGTVLVGVHVAVVLVVSGPERSDGTWASQAASRVGESGLVVGPEAALNVRVAVADEVHRALSAELDTVVGVVAVVGRTEVLELKACWDVNVRVAASLVGVPVVGRDTVVEVRATVGGAGQRRVSVGDFHQTLVEGLPCVGGRAGRDTEVGRGRHVTGVGVETRRGGVRNAGTLLAGLIHVADRPGVVGGTAVAVVLVLNLVGHVVEQGLNGTELTVGVVRHVSPLNNEHLVRVATLEGVGRRGVAVDAGGNGRNVSAGEVVLHRVVHFEVLNSGAPRTGSELTLCTGLAGFLGHGRRNPAASRATVGGDSVVEGGSNTSRAAHVETCGWVTCIEDGDRDRSALGVRVLHGAVDHLRLERVRRRCDVANLVGNVAGAGLATVEARAKSEPAPAVGGGRTVDHVVRRSTAVGADGPVEVVPAVGGNTQAVSGRGRLRCVERERTEGTGDVAWDGELVGLRVSVGHRGRGLAATGQRGVDAGFGVDTDGGPLVQLAVVHEDDVHARAVLGSDLQEAVAVVVPEVLVELVGTAVHAVVAVSRGGVSTSEPVTVEGAGAGVETGLRTRATVRGVELKEVLIGVAVVGQLAVHEALRIVVAACVDVRGQHGHLLVRGWCVGWVNDVNLVGRRRGLRTGQGRLVADVGAVAALVQVLELPVVLEIVAVGQVVHTGLEAAVGGGAGTGANGHEFTGIELVVGAQSVGGGAPGRSTVGGVVEHRCTAGRRVDTRHVGQLDEERSLTFDVRINSRVGDKVRGWGIGVRTTRVGDEEVRVAAAGGVCVRVEVRTATSVVLTNTDRTRVAQGVGDDGDTTGGGGTSGGGVTEVNGLPTGTAAADRGCGWRATDRGFEASSGGTTVV